MAGTTVASARKLLDLQVGKRRAVAAAAVLAALAPQGDAAGPGGAGVVPVGAGMPGGAAAAATAALTSFQEHAGLPTTGTADDQTVALIVAEAAHQHVVTSRMRTSRVQEMLAASDAAEARSRTVGDSTIDAVRRFQEANVSPSTGSSATRPSQHYAKRR